MKLQDTSCILCGSNQSDPWADENTFHMVKCADCGLVYLNPRPPLESIDEASRTGLHKSERDTLNSVGLYSKKKVKEYIYKIKELFPDDELPAKPCQWLDIGTGYGEFVEALLELTHPDSKLLGIDPCGPKVSKAKTRGVPVENANLSDVKETFTHISLINVISHLPDPIDFINELKNRMVKGCELIIVTGNGGDVSRQEYPGALYLPDHLSFLGEENVRGMLTKTGFRIKAINKYSMEMFQDNYVIGCVKNFARLILGRPLVPLKVSKNSKFRSLWIRAQRLD